MTDDNKLIHQGNLISLYKERVELPNDNHTYFDIVRHPGGAVVAAVNEHNEVCLLKQWRHAVQQYIWEFPAGCIEDNELALNDNDCVKHCDHQRSVPEDQEGAGGLDTGGGGGSENPGQ